MTDAWQPSQGERGSKSRRLTPLGLDMHLPS
jgi:hypothetical protein